MLLLCKLKKIIVYSCGYFTLLCERFRITINIIYLVNKKKKVIFNGGYYNGCNNGYNDYGCNGSYNGCEKKRSLYKIKECK